MQPIIHPKCPGENEAIKACMSKLCNKPALMCQNVECKCLKPHEDCELFSVALKTLI